MIINVSLLQTVRRMSLAAMENAIRKLFTVMEHKVSCFINSKGLSFYLKTVMMVVMKETVQCAAKFTSSNVPQRLNAF